LGLVAHEDEFLALRLHEALADHAVCQIRMVAYKISTPAILA
jgi:hypothetical protein